MMKSILTATSLLAVSAATALGEPVQLTSATGSTSSDPGECTCLVPAPSDATGVGSISAPRGEVLASSRSGLVPATSGARLGPGSMVLVGPKSWARINMGRDCSIGLGPNSEASIFKMDQSICLRVHATDNECGPGEREDRFKDEGSEDGWRCRIPLPVGAGIALAIGGGDMALRRELIIGGGNDPASD